MPILTNVLGFTDVSTLTIASGVVTVTQTMHIIAAETGTADDLATINISADIPTASGSTNFRTYILLRADSGDTITVKHGTGNISLGSGADYVLSGNKTLQLLYTGSAWVDLQSSVAASGLGGATGSTDNALLRADGTGGATVQASGVVVDDSRNMSNVANLALDSIQFTAATELTIASGVVTVTQSVHTIDTEGDAATDDLVTISGGATGDVIYLRAANDARTVVLKNGTGNILLYEAADVELDEDHKVVQLLYNGTNWLQIGDGNSGGGGGGGAPTTAEYITTASDGTLSAEVVIPGLAGSPDIKGAGGGGTLDFEFDSSGGTLPTWDVAPLTEDIDTTAKSHYYVKWDNTTASDKTGTWSWTPAGAFDIRAKFLPGTDQTGATTWTSGNAALHIQDSTNANRVMIAVSGTSIIAYTYTSSTYTQRGSTHTVTSSQPIYFRIARDGSNNITFYMSDNGVLWKLIATQAFTFTVNKAGLRVTNGTSTPHYLAVDWIRANV